MTRATAAAGGSTRSVTWTRTPASVPSRWRRGIEVGSEHRAVAGAPPALRYGVIVNVSGTRTVFGEVCPQGTVW
jgi:hypothetical protein